MTDNTSDFVFFSINQGEQAKQQKPNYLLAQDVYKKIADLLAKNLDNAKKLSDESELDDHRAHEAILLEGGRGTGKSAILVNLDLYLQKKTDIAKELLILKPIDPTLLEDGDDMFLNIFIAALVRNKEVKKKLDLGGRDAENFYDQLNRLGSALEGSQGQKDAQGIDKIRALISSASIADQVHKLFCQTLKLVGKKLIVLPIDDVDTALQHAYEKIEIVRKYLTSPYTVSIISGDLDLYNEVIWRDIHGRLLTDSKVERLNALDRAKELSIAYQRKILPLPRRIAVEKLKSYLENENIVLADTKSGEDQGLISFPKFRLWIDALLNERVNGVENSHLELPLETIREFAQLVSHLSKEESLFHELTSILKQEKSYTSEELKRSMFMQPEVRNLIAEFQKAYSGTIEATNKDKRSQQRQLIFTKLQSQISELGTSNPVGDYQYLNTWRELLRTYFIHHHRGGAVYLSLEANRYFSLCATSERKMKESIFETDLFRPKHHQKYSNFEQNADIFKQWQDAAQGKMTDFGLKNLPKTSILPYPVPEFGKQINKAQLLNAKNHPQLQGQENVGLVFKLVSHHNFYNKTNLGNLVLTGRVVELLVTSLVRNITVADISKLIARPPFFSAAEQASTKTFDFAPSESTFDDEEFDETGEEFDETGEGFASFVKEINQWRESNKADLAAPPQAWLIYNVINKYFNQVRYFNAPQNSLIDLLSVFDIALTAYRAIWAIFGSFEKGPTFGFDEVIAYVNVSGASKDFTQNQLYLQNIKPFLQKSLQKIDKDSRSEFFNFRTGSYTYLLSSHPLRDLLERTYVTVKNRDTPTNGNVILATTKSAPELSRELKPVLDTILKFRNIRTDDFDTLTQVTVKEILIEIIGAYKKDKSKTDITTVFEEARSNDQISGRTALGKLRRILIRIRKRDTDRLISSLK